MSEDKKLITEPSAARQRLANPDIAEHGRATRFQPGNKIALTPRRDIMAEFRKYLEDVDPKDPEGRTRLQLGMGSLYDMWKAGGKNATKAAELMLSRGYGREVPSEAELRALETGGIKVLVLNQPVAIPELPAPEPKKLEPVWIETNEVAPE